MSSGNKHKPFSKRLIVRLEGRVEDLYNEKLTLQEENRKLRRLIDLMWCQSDARLSEQVREQYERIKNEP